MVEGAVLTNTLPPATEPRPAGLRRALAVGASIVALAGLGGGAEGARASKPAYVAVLGTRIGPWRIGMSYRTAPGVVRKEHHPERRGGGCIAGVEIAPQIDRYRGIRLAWYDRPDGSMFLAEAATTRPGDRTSRGLTVGRTTFAQARRMYPHARLETVHHPRYSLGVRWLLVYRRTGYEAYSYLNLWFDRRGRLSGIATGRGGC